MKKLLALAMIAALAGCAHKTPDFGEAKPVSIPDLPADLAQRAEKLPPLTDPTMEGQLRDAIETDRRYNDVAHRFNSLLDLYECVKQSINNEKDAGECLSQ